MDKIVFYTLSELQKVEAIVAAVFQQWQMKWLITDVVDLDVRCANAEVELLSELVSEDGEELILSAGINNGVDRVWLDNLGLPESFNSRLLDSVRSSALADFRQLLQAQCQNDLGLLVIDLPCVRPEGHGVVHLSIQLGLFSVDFYACFSRLRSGYDFVELADFQSLDKVQDESVELECYLGSSSIAVEDLYLLKPGDVIKLDQALDSVFSLVNKDGKEFCSTKLCKQQDRIALQLGKENF